MTSFRRHGASFTPSKAPKSKPKGKGGMDITRTNELLDLPTCSTTYEVQDITDALPTFTVVLKSSARYGRRASRDTPRSGSPDNNLDPMADEHFSVNPRSSQAYLDRPKSNSKSITPVNKELLSFKGHAGDVIINMPEVLEQIFRHVKGKDLLLGIQATCRQFRDIVQTSPAIQMFWDSRQPGIHPEFRLKNRSTRLMTKRTMATAFKELHCLDPYAESRKLQVHPALELSSPKAGFDFDITSTIFHAKGSAFASRIDGCMTLAGAFVANTHLER